MKHLIHYFKKENINTIEDLKEINNEKFKIIIENHPDLMEIINLKDKIDLWKRAQVNHIENDSNQNSPKRSGTITLKRKQMSKVYVSFSEYFKKDFNGRIIAENHKIEPLLSNQQKHHIVQSAGEYLLLLRITDFPKEFPRESEYKAVAEEVIQQFPGIFSLDDLIGFKKKSESGSTSYTRGKLQQRLYDVAKLLRKKKARLEEAAAQAKAAQANDDCDVEVNIASCVEDDDFLQEDPLHIEEENKKALEFLKNNSGLETKVMELWKITLHLRREMLF